MSAQLDSLTAQSIFQIFVGRLEDANISDHEGMVLKRMLDYDWDELRKSSVDIVYLLGLWEVGNKIVVAEESGVNLPIDENRVPSPFAIVDHTKVWWRLGELDDLQALIDKIHQSGLRMVVDFVPNHTGLEHPWIDEHPDFYKTDVSGSRQRAFSGDVVELNYDNQGVQREMERVASTLFSYGIDGLRCDMAHLVPPFFWKPTIEHIREPFPQALFLAECYGSSVMDNRAHNSLIEAGFDGVYDGGFYENLSAIESVGSLNNLAAHIEYILHTNTSHYIHYVANHDDAFPLPERYLLPSLYLLSCLPGYRFYYNGNPQGFLARLKHHSIDVLEKHFYSPPFSVAMTDWFAKLESIDPTVTTIQTDGMMLILGWVNDNGLKGKIVLNFSEETYIDQEARLSCSGFQGVIMSSKGGAWQTL